MPEAPLRVLVIDDDATFRRVLAQEVTEMGHQVSDHPGLEPALAELDQRDIDVVLLDVRMPGDDGLAGLRRIRDRVDPPEVLMLTGHGSIEDAIECMRLGAYHYLTKPCRLDELELHLERAGQRRRLVERQRELLAHLGAGGDVPLIVGHSPPMLQVIEMVRRAAPTHEPVLIEGETGTGKEAIARMIHRQSAVSAGPFVIVNCGALSESVLQSELFGHEKGAFTGADRRRRGLLELADDGTLFLDEIGEVPAAMQVQLLRFLQSGELRRVGGNELLHVQVRLVAATNRILAHEVEQGRFREDLYYRLNTIHLQLPPLRERRADLPELAALFSARSPYPDKTLEPAALAQLASYDWPGNIRELRNIVSRLSILAEGPGIGAADVRRYLGQRLPTEAPSADDGPPLPLRELERQHILQTLEQLGGNKRETARVLGIALKTLYNKLHAYGVELD